MTAIKIETPYGEATLSRQGARYGFTFEKLTIPGTTTEASGTIALGEPGGYSETSFMLICRRSLVSRSSRPTSREIKILRETVLPWLLEFRIEWLV